MRSGSETMSMAFTRDLLIRALLDEVMPPQPPYDPELALADFFYSQR